MTERAAAPEPDLAAWLGARLSAAQVEEFFRTFGGSSLVVPKRPPYLIHQQRLRVLTAVSLRVAATGGILTNDIAHQVAHEAFVSPETVHAIWSTWKKKGRPELDGGASTPDATRLDNLRW